MTNHIELPKQPIRAVCQRCANCGGDAHHKRNGVRCVYCRTVHGWMVVPARGARTRNALPCDAYLLKNDLESVV